MVDILTFQKLVACQKGLDRADPDQTGSGSLFDILTSIFWIQDPKTFNLGTEREKCSKY